MTNQKADWPGRSHLNYMEQDCLICARIAQIKARTNPNFVAELETGYVVMGDSQVFRGYSLFLCKQHVHELHELTPEMRTKFLTEMSMVAEALFRGFKPRKLNYEILGNSVPHLHWHLFPRYLTDPLEGPGWLVDKSVRNAESNKPTPQELEILKRTFLKSLRGIAKPGIIRNVYD